MTESIHNEEKPMSKNKQRLIRRFENLIKKIDKTQKTYNTLRAKGKINVIPDLESGELL